MVATAHGLATDAGVEILERGGNAVDAAVAAALALGVCEPAASGIGGQTMMMIHLADQRRTIALDGSSRAPNRVDAEILTKNDCAVGYRATTVPSSLATYRYALRRYGRLHRTEVLAPSIRIAEQGFEVSPLLNRLMKREQARLIAAGAGSLYLTPDSEPWPVGSRLKNPALAATLEILSRKGLRDFYRGEIAARIDADMVTNGGLMRRDDLAFIPLPIERRAVSTHFRGDRVMTFPPPAAGRTLVEMLNIAGALRELPIPDTPRKAVLLAKVIRRAFRDRRDRPYSPSYYHQVKNKTMVSEEYAERRATDLEAQLGPEAPLRGETTHLSVMDGEGNVVALTQSIELVFGSKVLAADLGFLYNDYLGAFERRDITHPYYLRPNGVPWASVAPTIITRNSVPIMAIGSPGSERITSSILQVLMRLDRGASPYDAVAAPRLHCSLRNKVSLEAERMDPEIPKALIEHGFTIDERPGYSFYLGNVQLVMRDGDELVGVADLRRDGSARGSAK